MARDEGPMRIELTEDRRAGLAEATQRFFTVELGVELSEFQTTRLLDFFVRQLGAPVYNQAIHDARTFFQEKLDDLAGEFYEPEEPL